MSLNMSCLAHAGRPGGLSRRGPDGLDLAQAAEDVSWRAPIPREDRQFRAPAQGRAPAAGWDFDRLGTVTREDVAGAATRPRPISGG
jgi:hypothetical protein